MSRRVSNKPRRQHWVPRCYLRHFATPESKDSDDPLIWIFSKFEGDPRITSIAQIAAQNYLYSPTCEDGSRNWDMEDKLADLEGMAASVWPFLAGGFTDLQKRAPIRKAVALFAAVLHLRHPRMLVEVGRIHERLVTLFKSFPKDANGNPCIAFVDHQGVRVPFDASDWPQYKIASPDQKHKIFVDNINQHATSCAEILLKKRWSVVFSDAPLFITSDTPLALSNSGQEIFGLSTPGTIVSLPLSPTRILIMDDRHDQPDGQYYPLAKCDPAPFNFIAWKGCERFMLSPRPTDAVCAEMLSSEVRT